MNVILSIEPEYANGIINGFKTVEFRKVIFKKDIEKVFIYSSSPEKRIIGYFTISKIVKKSPSELWDYFGEIGMISKRDFFEYYNNKKFGYAICIKDVKRLKETFNPYELIEDFTAPQSYCYTEKDFSQNNIEHFEKFFDKIYQVQRNICMNYIQKINKLQDYYDTFFSIIK